MYFSQVFSTHADCTAVIDDAGAVLSYKDLADCALLVDKKIKRRTLVFVLCENSIGSLIGCVAFLNNQVVPLLLDVGLDRQFLHRLIETYQPEYIYLPERFRGSFSNYTVCLQAHNYALLKTNFVDQSLLHDDLAVLLTTSGSTGSQKLVRQSYTNLKANGQSIIEYLGIGQSERPITTLPMHYTYGFSIINSHLLAGATLLFTTATLVEKKFWDFLREQQATSFGGVPFTFETLKRLRFFGMALPSLKTITQAGGKLSVELVREFADYSAKKGIRFFVMYGQTEATARISYLPPEQALTKSGSIGIAIPGGELGLVNDCGSVLFGSDVSGELQYSGPNVSLGYAECRCDLGKGDERGGILLTGDLARRDQDGYYYLIGRKKRFIKMYGSRVNLDETEQLVKELVAECACCGNDDLMTIYITEAGREEDVHQHVASRTGIHPAAFSVRVIQRIPRNESGKTIYTELM
jgi:long-chain acyl-CoA synthetase